MGGSKERDDTNTLPDVISIPGIEDNIHSLCTDAREEVELHGILCRPDAIFIGKLYSDLHDCTVLFRRTVDAARLSDPYNDVPLPTNKNELKMEFDEMMTAYNLYNTKEMKLRKRCIEKVRVIETILDNMTNSMSLEECAYFYGFDPQVLTDYVLPKLIFVTKLVFRFRGMSETLLYCYQKRLGLIQDEKEKETSLLADSRNEDGEIYFCDDFLKYEAMKEYDDCLLSDEDFDSDDSLEFDEPSIISLELSELPEQQINGPSEVEQKHPSYYCNCAVKSVGFFIAAQIGVETVSYLAFAVADLICSMF